MNAVDPRGATAVLSIPDIRDYERINAEVAQRLDEGACRIRLAGAEGQRFLGAGLAGSWNAVIEIEGWAGPELAADLDAPGLTVVCHGPAGDGAGRSLRAGRLLIRGPAADALAYAQVGGTILAAEGAGARAGLNQRGGVLAILGPVGRLAAERQAGGLIFAYRDRVGPHAGRGARGGRLVLLNPARDSESDELVRPEELETMDSVLGEFRSWLELGAASEP